MGWSWGRPRAVYFSPLQIIAFLVFILLFLLSYYVLLPSEFARPIPTLFAFCYMIALFALSVFLAWSVVKVYRHIQKHSKQKQEQWDLVGVKFHAKPKLIFAFQISCRKRNLFFLFSFQVFLSL